MRNSINHYEVINEFFDCYELSYARSAVSRAIKAADSKKIWKGLPANLLYLTERLQQLIEAAFSIAKQQDYRPGVVIKKDSNSNLWFLAQYETYCGWHADAMPWDFFPRHLSKKEFLNPYKALQKFTRYQSPRAWKTALKEIFCYALSPNSIAKYDNNTSPLVTWLHLHKLIEATHLVEVRARDKKQPRRFKWKDRENVEHRG